MQHSGCNDERAWPCHVVRVDRPVCGRNIRQAAAGTLRIADVLQPLREKFRDVEEISFTATFLGAITEPALAFVALRTIRGHRTIIPASTPEDVRVNLVQQFVRAFELSGSREIIVDHAAFNRRERGDARQSRHLDVAETMICEARLPDFFADTTQCVDVRDACATQVRHVKRAVGIERLSETHLHTDSGRAFRAQPTPANDVLSHVVDQHAGLHFIEREWVNGLCHADGINHLCGKIARSGDKFGCLPCRIIEPDPAPVAQFLACVVFFTVKFSTRNDRSVRREFP